MCQWSCLLCLFFPHCLVYLQEAVCHFKFLLRFVHMLRKLWPKQWTFCYVWFLVELDRNLKKVEQQANKMKRFYVPQDIFATLATIKRFSQMGVRVASAIAVHRLCIILKALGHHEQWYGGPVPSLCCTAVMNSGSGCNWPRLENSPIWA